MRQNRILLGLLLSAVLALVGSCSVGSVSDGGGTDYPNTKTVAGVLVGGAGAPVDSGRVLLVRDISGPHDPLPRFLFDTTWSLANGRFAFEGVSPGAYAVEALSKDGSRIAYVGSVTASEERTTLDTLSLEKTGSLRGTVIVRPGLTVILAIASTHYMVIPDSLGRFEFPVLPQGNWDLTIIVLDSTGSMRELDTTLVGQSVRDSTVLPGDIDLPIIYSAKHARKLTLNTTISGAWVNEDMHSFPIAVRLDSTRLDFSTAAIDGGDIRFLRPDGKVLPHQIELWDSQAQTAVVWIRVDTIFGNSRQSLYMVWGDTISESTTPVFDSSNGFRGVWHLSEESAGTGVAGAFKDATTYLSHGIDYVSDIGKEGIIGKGQRFDGVDDYIEILPAIQLVGEFTVSLWVKADEVPVDNQGYRLVGTYREPWDTLYGFMLNTHNNDFSFTAATGSTPNQAGSWDTFVAVWTHVAVTFVSGTGATECYINGEKKTDDSYAGPNVSYINGIRTFISDPWRSLKGNMDEVRFESVRRSDSWIRLCCENQKVRQTLVEF